MEELKMNGSAQTTRDNLGNLVLDPTANVLALSEASNKRQDDLREAFQQRVEASIQRLDREICHLEDNARLRADHAKEISYLETKRLDAVRQVDVNNAATSTAQALTAIETLAKRNAEAAETLRKQQESVMASFTERIMALEKASYEGAGRKSYADPALAELTSQVSILAANKSEGAGKQKGISMVAAVVLGGVAFISSLLGIIGILMHFMR
jgi:hypothetical protein